MFSSLLSIFFFFFLTLIFASFFTSLQKIYMYFRGHKWEFRRGTRFSFSSVAASRGGLVYSFFYSYIHVHFFVVIIMWVDTIRASIIFQKLLSCSDFSINIKKIISINKPTALVKLLSLWIPDDCLLLNVLKRVPYPPDFGMLA